MSDIQIQPNQFWFFQNGHILRVLKIDSRTMHYTFVAWWNKPSKSPISNILIKDFQQEIKISDHKLIPPENLCLCEDCGSICGQQCQIKNF